MQLTGALFGLLGMMVAMLSQDVRLALACFTIIPVMVLICAGLVLIGP